MRAEKAAGNSIARSPVPALVVLAISAFAALSTEVAPVGLLPVLNRDFHQTSAMSSLLVTAFAVMVMLFAVPLALLTRRFTGKRMLLIAVGGYFLSDLLCAVAPSFGVLLVARAVGGAAHAVYFSACIGQATRMVPRVWVARALGVVSAGISAGYIVGPPLANALGNVGGWRLAFAALIALTAATVLLIALVLPGIPVNSSNRNRSTHGRAAAAGVIAANGLTYLGQHLLFTYVTVLLLGAGLPPALATGALLAFGLAGLAGIRGAAPLLDHRPRWTSVGVLVLLSVSLVAVGFASKSGVLVVISGLLWGAMFGSVSPLFQSAAVRSAVLSPELAGAWVNSTANLGIAVGAAAGGAILERFGFAGLGLVAAVPVLIAALLSGVSISSEPASQ